MSVVYVAMPVTILIATGFVIAFVLAVRRGQFDDLDTPAYRILFDDEAASDAMPHDANAANEREA